MPELSRFFGIIIAMFFDDHAPPHFYVRYGAQRAIMAIETLEIIGGSLPPRARGLATEWPPCISPNCVKHGSLRAATLR